MFLSHLVSLQAWLGTASLCSKSTSWVLNWDSFVSFCLVSLLTQNVLLVGFSTGFGKPVREFQELLYSKRDFWAHRVRTAPYLCGKRQRPRFATPEASLWPGLVPSRRSSVPHLLLGCWTQRGSCLERAGDIWGDDREIGLKLNLLINLSSGAVLGAPRGQQWRELGCTWGREAVKSLFSLHTDCTPNQAWNR